MACVDILTSKDCQINWELLDGIQNKPLSDMASSFVRCIYTYNKLTTEFANVKRVLEYTEATYKKLSEKCNSIESSKKAECERLQNIIDEQKHSIQTLTATINKIYSYNNTQNSHKETETKNNETIQADVTPRNEKDTSFNSQLSIEFMSLNDEVMSINDTVNEINGTPPINNRSSQTPTSRTSPIICAGKYKTKLKDGVNCNRNVLHISSFKSKVKKLKQGRLTFSEAKARKLIDVSHSESFCGGTRSVLHKEKDEIKNTSSKIAPEDNEVILPSPTSDISRLQFHATSKKSSRSMTKPSPQKIINNVTMIKAEFKHNAVHIDADATNCIELELDQQTTRCKSMAAPLLKPSPTKSKSIKKKSPLGLNKNTSNIANTYTQYNTNVSLSVLDAQPAVSKENVDVHAVQQDDTKSCNKRNRTEPPQFIYKEDAVRKKADKRKLLGWSCTNCKEFYEEAYKDDEERLEKAKQECSKHRGKFNPEKCSTPPGFWDIRFSPPQDTEAFNRQNDV